MTTVRRLEWEEIRRLYISTFKECLKLAKQSHQGLSAPEARSMRRHPVYGFGCAVEITWHGRNEGHEQLEGGAKAIEEGAAE